MKNRTVLLYMTFVFLSNFSTILGNVEKVGVAPDPKRVGPASWNLEYG